MKEDRRTDAAPDFMIKVQSGGKCPQIGECDVVTTFDEMPLEVECGVSQNVEDTKRLVERRDRTGRWNDMGGWIDMYNLRKAEMIYIVRYISYLVWPGSVPVEIRCMTDADDTGIKIFL